MYSEERIQELIVKARKVREKAYSPYSKFRVGAVLVTTEEKEYYGKGDFQQISRAFLEFFHNFFTYIFKVLISHWKM